MIAQLVDDDGFALVVDGAKDLFRFLLSPWRSSADPNLVPVTGIFVTGYLTGEFIDARKAVFVTGSDVLGPTGEELIAFDSDAEAREFSARHPGAGVVGFDRVDLSLISVLT